MKNRPFKFNNQDELVAFLNEHVLTRREAEEYLNISKQSFTRALSKGKVHYFKAVGEGKGKVQLFLKQDLEAYRHKLATDLKKYNPHVAKDKRRADRNEH